MITQSYKLNIVPYAEQTVRGMTSPKVPVSQYDKGLRTLVFDLYDGANGRLTLLDGQTAKIYGKKPDTNVFEYDMTISEDRQSVSIVLQEQMAVIAGCVECEVRIFHGVSTIGSANFTLIVEPAPVGAEEVYSESEIPEIDNLLYGGTAGQVFTKTPTGAHWADLGTSSDFMLKSVYDPNDDGSVLKADHADDADTVDGHTVARNVLADEYTNAQIDGLIEQAGKVKTVNNVQPDQSGNVQITKTDIGLGDVDNTSDASKPISTATQAALDLKVDKVDGKGLSTNDYTDADKTKLGDLPTGEEITVALAGKVDTETGKGLSTNDFTDAEKTKLQGIETGAQVNTVTGVKGSAESTYRTGNIDITKANIGLGNVDNTSDLNKPISTATQTALDGKVDKVTGKGLSENDYTTADKDKLAGIAAGAEVNVQSNWNESDSSADSYIQNKPAIPAKTSDLQNDSGFITGVNWGAIGGTLADQADLNNELTALNTGLNSVEEEIDAINTSTLIEDTEPYLFKSSARENVVGNIMSVHKIIGGTVAWNQLYIGANRTAQPVGVALTVNNESVTLNGTATNTIYARLSQQNVDVISGHIYYISGYPSGLSLGGNGRMNVATNSAVSESDTGEGKCFKATTDATTFVQIQLYSGMVYNHTIKPQLFDLTQMFGSTIADYIYSLEQSTAGAGVAFFRNLFPNNYYAYNAGELISVKTSAHVMRGFNQWDEEWEVYTQDKSIISKNLIPVMPNTNYCFVKPANTYLSVTWKDYRGYQIGDVLAFRTTASTVFKSPADSVYCTIVCGDIQRAYPTYNHDICINVSEPAKNGTYEPYNGHPYPLDPDLELRGIPKLDSNNNLYYDGDEYEPSGTVTRKYEKRAYQSGDESLADAITDGTNTVVKLATPTTETADTYDKQQVFDVTGTEEYVDTRTVPIPVGHDTFFPTSLTSRIDALEDEFNEEITGLSESIAPIETSPATATHASGTYLMYQNRLYKVIASIAVGETLTAGTNIQVTTIMEELLALTA